MQLDLASAVHSLFSGPLCAHDFIVQLVRSASRLVDHASMLGVGHRQLLVPYRELLRDPLVMFDQLACDPALEVRVRNDRLGNLRCEDTKG